MSTATDVLAPSPPKAPARTSTGMGASLPGTLPGRVAYFARLRPHHVALREKQMGIWREHTWADYHRQVAAAARALHELGVREGDSVSILSDNRPEWLIADLAAQSLGARGVGIYQTNPPPDVAYILNDSRSKVLFVEDQEQLDKAVEIADQTPTVEHVVVIDPRGTRGVDDPRLMRWEGFLARGLELHEADPGWYDRQLEARDPKAPAMVVYTSGTTGPPKGAMISSENVLATSGEFVEMVGITADDVILSYLPLAHVAEKIFSLFLPLSTGAVVHFGESIETVQNDLREVSPTVFLGVPRIWEKMHASVSVKMQDASWLKRKLYTFFTALGQRIARRRLNGDMRPWDWMLWLIGDLLVFRALQERLGLRRVRLAVSGAAPISADLLLWFHGIGVRIQEGYGQTEGAGVSHLNLVDGIRLGTVGTPIPGVECRISEDDGEVLIRGANVFPGYLNRPDATRETVDDEGWLHTGDVGEVDEDGYLRITGRKKEIIITSGGKNLSPEKIENALKTSPYIKEAVAIGDGRKFVSALIQIELDSVGDWAARRSIPYTSFEDLTRKEEVQSLIAAEVRKANDLLARVEQVRGFRLLPKELHQDDGELTPTQKVKRSNVLKKFDHLVEDIYGGGKD
ncbi:MAG: AMP-dependent synthetase/ligase [Myxococcota bacterium]